MLIGKCLKTLTTPSHTKMSADINALLVAAGHNLRLILNWLRLFVAWIMAALISLFAQPDTSQAA